MQKLTLILVLTLVSSFSVFSYASDIITIKESEILNVELASILSSARAVPVLDKDGKAARGYRFVEIKKDSIFRKLGFLPKDVVLKVNGLTITTGSMQIYESIRKSDTFKIQIERNKKPKTLTVKIKR